MHSVKSHGNRTIIVIQELLRCNIQLKGNIIFKGQQVFHKAIAEMFGIFLFNELSITSKQIFLKTTNHVAFLPNSVEV